MEFTIKEKQRKKEEKKSEYITTEEESDNVNVHLAEINYTICGY